MNWTNTGRLRRICPFYLEGLLQNLLRKCLLFKVLRERDLAKYRQNEQEKAVSQFQNKKVVNNSCIKYDRCSLKDCCEICKAVKKKVVIRSRKRKEIEMGITFFSYSSNILEE